MISRDEVLEFAREFQLAANVVEKDYALGWLLAGISSHQELSDTWVFKGGTCLKKCFFETYRFSEDLDFTLRDPAHLNEAFLARVFAEVAEWVYENSGLEMPVEAQRFEIFTNPRGSPAAQGRVGYRGPLARGGDLPRIKLDLASDEVLVLDPVRRHVHHPYSDEPEAGIEVLCYAFEEVFAEKIRALAERQRPRDLYDVIHLHRHQELGANRNLVRTTLGRKCEFKNIPVPSFGFLANRPEREEIEAEWETMLAHQLPVCPPFEQFWTELPGVFVWLEREEIVVSPAPARIAALTEQEDETWQAPAMATAWGYQAPLETIRFAAANRLCVELGYQGSTRSIEPYSLRRTKANDLLLYAVRSDNSEIHAYRVDRIESAAITRRTFVPRFAVELTAAGAIVAPSASSGEPRARLGLPRSRTPVPRRTVSRRRSAPAFGQIKYIFECPACHKRFTRSSYDATLNPHKNKQGWDCYGSVGHYRGTRH
ncbi:MAG TPA: nucleotidyl transferase AbiEii/AbiGii toxin family protein [Steroidobacteraceae bacterium]|nr:nucleotidyl transferase AbiEii/AbiGii toxin family protein [Steroidobacteraceae bacterium]